MLKVDSILKAFVRKKKKKQEWKSEEKRTTP